MHRICGVSNAGDGDERVQACIAALPRTVPWNVTDFAYNVNWWQVMTTYCSKSLMLLAKSAFI